PGTAVPARPHDPEVTMTDAYTRFIRTAPGRALAGQLGLPRPARLLRREDRPEPVLGPVVVLGDSAGADRIAHLLLEEGADVRRRFEELRRRLGDRGARRDHLPGGHRPDRAAAGRGDALARPRLPGGDA